ncbi:MAG: hypothetical protein NZ455_08690 [Bacteroidia bacterium]|nr:hypothetical protein [Bacteroidia bacterium]MDW8345609.1 hypothetical protein [Bacteroidia bacterium]
MSEREREVSYHMDETVIGKSGKYTHSKHRFYSFVYQVYQAGSLWDSVYGIIVKSIFFFT